MQRNRDGGERMDGWGRASRRPVPENEILETIEVPFEIEFRAEEPFVRVTTTGSLTREGFERFIEALIAHSNWRRGMSILSDYREAEARPLSAADIRAMSVFYAGLQERLGPGKSALVVSESLDYGIARMWISLTEMKVSREIRVFHALEEAEAWLKQSETA
jgi:hypothetical protein